MDFDEVDTGLFLGSRRAVAEFAASHSSAAISVVTVESEDLTEVPQTVARRMFVQVDDIRTADLLSHFDDINAFIKDGLLGGLVFVHCRHGVSRSATVCAAYLMRTHCIGAQEALARIRRCRMCVAPNVGFRRQLELYSRLGCHTSLQQREFRRYRLRGAARAIAADRSSLPMVAAPLILPDPGLAGSSAIYRCRQCRRVLFSDEAVVSAGREEESSSPSDGSYRLLPLPWMSAVVEEPKGKLNCFKCSAKLGSFSWLSDSKLATDEEFEPSFLITRSRVDRCLSSGPGAAPE